MTVQSKTTIKSYFTTGSKPTAAQFTDLADSYFNADAVSTLGAAIVSASTATSALALLGFSAYGQTIVSAATTAAAQSLLSLSYATTAQATAGTATGVTMDPVLVKNAISSQGGNQVVLLGTATASVSSTLDFTSMIGSGYSKYILVFKDLLNSASASVGLKISSDNGATWTTALYAQLWNITIGANTAIAYSNTSNATPAVISDVQQLKFNGEANFTVNGASGFLWEGLLASGIPSSSPFKSFVGDASATIINAIRLLPSSGTFTSGTVYLYGVKNT